MKHIDSDKIARILSHRVYEMNGARLKKGDLYGLELELEGRNIAMDRKAVKGWTQVADGSLRGESTEYVFSAPCGYDEALDRVDRLFQNFQKEKVVIRNSYRTSTHVHMNFSDKTLMQVLKFFILFTILEGLLESYCGESRVGNVFCLPSRDVEPIIRILQTAVMTGNIANLNENVRYCACNLAALNKFGTIEVRTMRGAENADQVKQWLSILKDMYEYALNKMDSPLVMINNISYEGTDAFLRSIFSDENYTNLIRAWNPEGDLNGSIYEGIRLVQLLVYKFEDAFGIRVEPNPIQAEPAKKPKKRRVDGNTVNIIGNPRYIGLPRRDVNERIREGGVGRGSFWLDTATDRHYFMPEGDVIGEIPEGFLTDTATGQIVYELPQPGAPVGRRTIVRRDRELNGLSVWTSVHPPLVPNLERRILYNENEDNFIDLHSGHVFEWQDN